MKTNSVTSVAVEFTRPAQSLLGTAHIITSGFPKSSNDLSVKSLEWACSLSLLYNRRGLAV